jgi:hypothetical protein
MLEDRWGEQGQPAEAMLRNKQKGGTLVPPLAAAVVAIFLLMS